jgi:fumarate hydratase class I
LTPGKLEAFLIDKMKSLGTAACPPYHLAFVIGGTSAEANLKTVKLASAKYYDNLPTEGNELGQAFRDIELEERLKKAVRGAWGLGAQFGGKYFAARYSGGSLAAAWRLLSRGDGCLLLGRPQYQGED